MAVTETRIDRGDHDEVRRVVTDDATGVVVATIDSIEWKPGTPEHDEPINREALADLYHSALTRVAVLRRADPVDLPALVDALSECALLAHRFIHADYTDAEV